MKSKKEDISVIEESAFEVFLDFNIFDRYFLGLDRGLTFVVGVAVAPIFARLLEAIFSTFRVGDFTLSEFCIFGSIFI